MKSKYNFNTVYISERVQECLRRISRCPLTAVVAPMGYGKTTAVNWYLAGRSRAENAAVVRVSIYADNPSIFWRRVQSAFASAGLDFLSDYSYPQDRDGAALLADELCASLGGTRPCYIFLDDFHLLGDGQVASFCCSLADRLPDNVHMVIASRDRFVRGGDIVRLGGKLHQIGAEQLRLNYTELAAYAHRCGTELSERQTEALLNSSEGWFSAIYLNLLALSERGELLDEHSDIYEMFTSALIDPLPPREQEFLAAMSLADEFTLPMAENVSGFAGAEDMLLSLTQRNAFVARLPDGVTFRFHHMLKDCAGQIFSKLPRERQGLYLERYGVWYERHGQYLYAIEAYCRCEDHDRALGVVEKDAGIMLAGLRPEQLLDELERCPVSVLEAHPLAILVLMRRMFTWHRVPKMLELKELLYEAVNGSNMPEQERGDLLGECDLIMSFLMYNDISKMSALHRSASRQMSRPAVTIKPDGTWTFGSPSVLMMYHNAPGNLRRELAEMNECMPHYYKITNGHGQGAELVMDAEAALMQGRFADCAIDLERARVRIAQCGQENMDLCCDLLALRMGLFGGGIEYDFAKKREALLKRHDTVLLNIFDSISAYWYAMLRQPKSVPEKFREHQLSEASFLAPARPMMEMIENQVLLSQGEYAKVIGRSEALLAACVGMHYALVELHVRIQTAAAFWMLGRRGDAEAMLHPALKAAADDGFTVPFAENYPFLAELLSSRPWGDEQALAEQIIALGKKHSAVCAAEAEGMSRPAQAHELTERELEIAYLAAGRATNREIAEKLFLSEGTVKQYINQIYSKLHIDGDTRTKRRRLAALMGSEN